MKQITEEKDDAEWKLTEEEREIFFRITGAKRGDIERDDEKRWLAKEAVNLQRQIEIAQELAHKQPDLGFTAFLIAGDMLGAERAVEMVNCGIPPLKALRFVGSYARFDFAVKQLSDDLLFPRMCQLWQAADPDDTNPLYLNTWVRAYLANGSRCLRDGAALPPFKRVKIWRGQMPDGEIGFAWSAKRSVAVKFAKGASYRRPVQGVLLSAYVNRADVLAYITGRGEFEVIVPPKKLIDPGLEARVVPVARRKGAK